MTGVRRIKVRVVINDAQEICVQRVCRPGDTELLLSAIMMCACSANTGQHISDGAAILFALVPVTCPASAGKCTRSSIADMGEACTCWCI